MPEPKRTLVTVGDKLAVGTCAACERRYDLSQTKRHLIGADLHLSTQLLPVRLYVVTGSSSEQSCGIAAHAVGGGGRISQAMDFDAERLYAKFSPVGTPKASRDRMRADIHALKQGIELSLLAMHSDRIVFEGLLGALPQPIDVRFPACSEARMDVTVLAPLALNYAWRVSVLVQGTCWWVLGGTTVR